MLFLYSTGIIHFFVPLLSALLCVIVISSWAHSVALIVQMNRIRFARKFNGSFWRNLAADWHYDGARCLCGI